MLERVADLTIRLDVAYDQQVMLHTTQIFYKYLTIMWQDLLVVGLWHGLTS